MPSKGSSRTASQSRTAAIAPSDGPAVTATVPVAEARLPAVVGEALGAGAAVQVATATEPEPVAFIPELEDGPDIENPAWADLYARTVEQHREERDRIDREQAESQRLWEEFLAAQGSAVPEGERSLADNDELHEPWAAAPSALNRCAG